MRRPILTLFVGALAICASASTIATAAGGAITVQLNESRRVTLAGSAANVVVGDARVADVAMIDAHDAVVMGKGYGSTQLIITDKAGHTLLSSVVSVVSPDNGRVTVFHGLTQTDFTCGGRRCHPLAPTPLSSGGSGGGGWMAGGPSAPDRPIAAMSGLQPVTVSSAAGAEMAAAAAANRTAGRLSN